MVDSVKLMNREILINDALQNLLFIVHIENKIKNKL